VWREWCFNDWFREKENRGCICPSYDGLAPLTLKFLSMKVEVGFVREGAAHPVPSIQGAPITHLRRFEASMDKVPCRSGESILDRIIDIKCNWKPQNQIENLWRPR
jgi:hypothetical protein